MLFPVTEPEKWAKLYKIEPDTVRCNQCGNTIARNVPFAVGRFRGFRTEEHGCHPDMHEYKFGYLHKRPERLVDFPNGHVYDYLGEIG